MNPTPIKQMPFFHVTLQGESYAAGRKQGELLRSIPGWLNFMRSGAGVIPPTEFRGVLAAFERFCPGLNEEIHGMADGAGISPADVVYYSSTWLRPPQPAHACSQMVVLPGASADGHTLAARSFDFSDRANDFRLCTTRIAGRFAHIGCSILLFGRSEGLNEHGLAVCTSSGGMPIGDARPASVEGFQFWALVRSLLENCRNVGEALAAVQDFPNGGNPVLLLADRSGQAARVELFGKQCSIQRADASFLCAANHFTLAGTAQVESSRMAHSLVRQSLMEQALGSAAPRIRKEDLKNLFSTPYPRGLCCHYYSEFFGCLHAALFDLEEGSLEIAFGSPAANRWRKFTLSTPSSPAPFMASLPQEQAPASFWEMV